jgi:hypothetical protein
LYRLGSNHIVSATALPTLLLLSGFFPKSNELVELLSLHKTDSFHLALLLLGHLARRPNPFPEFANETREHVALGSTT